MSDLYCPEDGSKLTRESEPDRQARFDYYICRHCCKIWRIDFNELRTRLEDTGRMSRDGSKTAAVTEEDNSKGIALIFNKEDYQALEKLKSDSGAGTIMDVINNAFRTYEKVVDQFNRLKTGEAFTCILCDALNQKQ